MYRGVWGGTAKDGWTVIFWSSGTHIPQSAHKNDCLIYSLFELLAFPIIALRDRYLSEHAMRSRPKG